MQLFEFHEIPDDHIIKITPHSFLFVNLRPFVPYHILASPKRVVANFTDLLTEEVADLFNLVHSATLVLKDSNKNICDGFTINIQDGKNAGQKVFHVHVHIVPRNYKDVEGLDEIYKEGRLDCYRCDRDYDEMKKEAMFLKEMYRKYYDRINLSLEKNEVKK